MNYEIVDSFSQMVREKGIDRDRLVGIIEDIFGMMVRKKFGQEANYEIVVNMDKGDIEVFLVREVVEHVEDPATQVTPEYALEKTGEKLQPGDECVEIIDLRDFGRRLIVTAKQNLNQRIKEIEKDLIYDEYSEKINDIVVGEIYQVRKHDVLINHNRTELILPKSEQIPRERYRKGDTIRCLIKSVERKGNAMPRVIVTRADSLFLRKLFEMEIPEIYDNVISIVKIAREPGERAKVAVESNDDRIDAVGACVGMKGVRIHAIVRELHNENIDVINYTDDPYLFLTRALAPAKLEEIKLDREEKTAYVYVEPDQASLAIGRNGQNIRLASELTGFKIEIVKIGEEEPKLDEYEMDMIEFQDDFGAELVQQFINAGYIKVNDVIEAEKEEILFKVPGLDADRLDEIITTLKEEFKEAEEEEMAEVDERLVDKSTDEEKPATDEEEDEVPVEQGELVEEPGAEKESVGGNDLKESVDGNDSEESVEAKEDDASVTESEEEPDELNETTALNEAEKDGA